MLNIDHIRDAVKPDPPPKPVQSYETDPCCGRAIAQALREGKLDTAEIWQCPKCGLEWRPSLIAGVRHWIPCPAFAVVRNVR